MKNLHKLDNFITEKKVAVKRRYTEKYPAKNVSTSAKVRNAVLTAIADGHLTEEEVSNILSEISAHKRWLNRNLGLFNISEDENGIKRYSLSPYGQRVRKATLNESEESLIAQAGLMAGTAHEIYNIFSNADLPYPEVKLTNGEDVKIDPTNYSLLRESKNRDDRKVVFYTFFETLEKFQRSLGTQLYGELKKNIFYKNVRKYESALEASLDSDSTAQT